MFLLARPNGDNLIELRTARGRQLNFKRNGVPEANMSIAHEDTAAGILFDVLRNEGIPRLKGYRTNRDGSQQLRFAGYLAPFEETLDESSNIALTFRGAFGRLVGDGEGSGRFTTDFVTYIADAGQIGVNLINAYASNAGLVVGTIEATKTRERTYEFANVGQAIIDLTTPLDGFDFEVAPLDGGSDYGTFNVYARQGSEVAATFEYGEDTLANVRSVRRTTMHPINVTRVLGADGLVGEDADATSRAKYGDCWRQISATDVREQSILDDKAYALLRPNPIEVVQFTPDPALAPLPWDDYWIGDTVGFNGRRAAFLTSQRTRVNEIGIVVDDDSGEEVMEIPDPTDPDEERVLRAEMTVEFG